MPDVIFTIPLVRHRTAAKLVLPEWPDADDLDDIIEQLRFRIYMMDKQTKRQYLKAPIKYPPVKWDPHFNERNKHA